MNKNTPPLPETLDQEGRIARLTAEQEAELVRFRDEWLRTGTATSDDSFDMSDAQQAVFEAYAEANLPPPKEVLVARSPMEALEMAAKRLGTKDLYQVWTNGCWCWGQSEGYWVAHYLFANQIGVQYTDQELRQLAIWERLAKTASMVVSYEDFAVVSRRPVKLTFDSAGRLHSTDGPATLFSDGFAMYGVHGVRLPSDRGAQLISAPTIEDIRTERNAEVRRVLVDIYERGDKGKYLRDAGAQVLHEDTDKYGRTRRLLRIELPNDEPYVAVEVTNSSPEPDGTFKKYTLRVHPELRPMLDSGYGDPQELTCQNAIASTFGKKGEEYNPLVET